MFEIEDITAITAITIMYYDDIVKYIKSKKEEILQIDISLIVIKLFESYSKCNVEDSVLELINNKTFKLRESVNLTIE